ncbi:MAG: bifunctional histidinol-phosphatase/imidazoleglycerol-phosphate dehydratase HisB [Saprospiraceae bacterium]|nr:bifunctional histidinol-phosphatase/imidazoleglycerol-phosphate dehydratase HisB [Saprospiraceae bacterium]
MKKVLFIDRDGTIIVEPEDTFQVDSMERLEFLPSAISSLKQIAGELDFELVMVTNQDGLGTASFPEKDFWPAHNLMLKVLAGEGIDWREIVIDRSFAADDSPDRKPGIGRVRHYLSGDFDLERSFVIGDRLTDMIFAKNLGCHGIFLGKSADTTEDYLADSMDMQKVIALETDSWPDIVHYLKNLDRQIVSRRETNETSIEVELNLDGTGKTSVDTGLPFFDHMLDQLGKHGGVDLRIRTKGDLHIDEHHTVEDTALALGETFLKALGNKRGTERYGFALPMDDCEAMVTLDFGGRPWLIWDVDFKREKVGDLPTEMIFHFFKSFSDAAKCNLHIKARGENEHHKIEAIFKSFARSVKRAVRRDMDNFDLPSTKGTL